MSRQWTLPDPKEALRRWMSLLRTSGRLALIEGRWATAELDQLEEVGSDRSFP
ncbi:hypothetical protein [Streptosporangium amethystogenes]|uniref:hypothetical protein n=1 Tax=Streptosporangium amethystogenes TaxID=2002 RepID=UPI0012F8B4E4|nr:hypothetical protein [Streptosporangium amethystogenes]